MPPLFAGRVPRLACGALAVLVISAPPSASAREANLAPLPAHEDAIDGQRLYAQACATCHGSDGRGAPREHVAFTDPLPDFTDCSFATREPDVDWMAVIHDGGPARAFGLMMPAYGLSLSTSQLEAVVAYTRTLCTEPAWPRGELNLPRPLVTEKAFPEDELVFSSGVATEGDASISSKLVYERRIGPVSQVEVVVPFYADKTGRAWSGGVGDIGIGGKRALAHSRRRGSIFSAAAEIVLPTGNEARGFGKGTPIFEPFLAYGQIVGADGFLQFQAGTELPFDRDRAAPEAFWRMVAGRSFSQQRWGRTWSPMVELVAARELAGGQDAHWALVPQMQVTLSTRQHIMAAGGVRIPLTDASSRSTQVLFYFLWDWFDGPLFGGW